eukprot:TRINITY_DN5628_c0_g1_i2.p1 TRINITY_DN5628_c0_g1~~TRINITY_DN5628_c0_g1_i2.p1  ORF type:complete len:821 (+),score=294.37 TRINITY_DN5628_c0_g1_i2:36-2465(+)
MSKFKGKKSKKKAEPEVPKKRNTILKRKQERQLKKKLKKEGKKQFIESKSKKKEKIEEEEAKKAVIEKEKAKKKERLKKKKENKAKKLEKEQSEQRKNRLLEDNKDEEKEIKRLEKLLGMKRRKSKNLPKSFLDDGLDYLFGSTTGDVAYDGLGSDLEDMGEFEEGGSNAEESGEDGMENASDNDQFDDMMEAQDDSEGEEEISGEEDENEDFDDQNVEDEGEESDYDDGNDPEQSDDENEASENDDENKSDNDGVWEDIYGRKRAKDGSIIGSEGGGVGGGGGKYIPPALRKAAGADKKKDLERLKKQLKGNLNRLAESNMHSIAAQIENMYRQNSRNDMNETIFSLITEAIVSPVNTPERLVTEYAMLIAIMHANVGSEVGAHFIEEFNKLFFQYYRTANLNEDTSKELDNIMVMLAYIFNFRIIDSKYIFELLSLLIESFKPKDIELILVCLRTAGFVIRKADPLAMKNLILEIQNKASTCASSDSRVQFMLDVLLAVKNNNVNKIPNYDPSHFEHLKKILKTFIREGNFVSEMKIGLKDLENADTLGGWWIVGSYYAGNLVGSAEGSREPGGGREPGGDNKEEFSAKLLELARKMRMNTDSRRKIFCIIMSAEDYLDATEKLLKLGTKNQTERDVMFVLLDSSVQEKTYNPFYAHLAVKLSGIERKYRLANQFCIWDKIKLTADMKDSQLENLGKYISHMVREKSQSIAVLRTVHFAEMNKPNVKLLRQVIFDVLLNEKEEDIRLIFEVVSKNPKLNMFREGFKLFLRHFILKKKKHLDKSLDFNKVEERVKLAEFYLTTASLKL